MINEKKNQKIFNLVQSMLNTNANDNKFPIKNAAKPTFRNKLNYFSQNLNSKDLIDDKIKLSFQ